MSVLIKDMQIPENCLDCPIYDHYNYHCNLYGYGIPARYNYDPSKRPEWCELKELPEHHGGLIDADELKTAFPPCDNNMNIKIASARATINHMPTIIEAE